MSGERRTAHRALIPGMRVVFEGVAGERVEADVVNVGSGGLFIRTSHPLAIGKRLSLEIEGVADVAAWSALGRVVWTREAATADSVPGMGVKLIDVDDAVVAAVERLVDARAGTRAPARERTELGLGVPQKPPPEELDVPDVHGMPTREVIVPRMVLVMSAQEEAPAPEPAPQTPALERSIAIDLVARKPQVDGAPSVAPSKRGGRGWLVFLVLLALAGVALYLTGGVPWAQRLVETTTASPPAPAPPPASVAPGPTVPTATATATPTAAPTAVGTPSRAPEVRPTPSKAPARAAHSALPAAAPRGQPAGDNPY